LQAWKARAGETRALLGGAVTLAAGKAEAEAVCAYVRNINGVRVGVLARF
jgi:hypothetical protein